MATWTTPKTGWVKTDYFTYEDYNRIKNNLTYLNDIFNEEFSEYDIDLGDDKEIGDYVYASEFNAFEDCIENFSRIGVDLSYGTATTFYDNGAFPNYDNIERWEQSCLRYYNYDIPVKSVTVSPSTTTFTTNSDTVQLTATIYPTYASNKNVTWSSSNTNRATVDDDGLVTIVSGCTNGTVTITVTTEDGGYTDTCEITIAIAVTSVTLTPSSLTVYKEYTSTITASYLPTNALADSWNWYNSDGSVISLTSSGTLTVENVTGVDDGSAEVYLTIDGVQSNVVTVEVTGVPVESVTVSPSTLTLTTNGETSQLTATVYPTDAENQNVTWTSSDTSIVTVDSDGLVTVVDGCESGDVTITATTEDGGYTDTCVITVDIEILTLTLSPSSTSVYVGDTVGITATYTPTNANILTTSWQATPASAITIVTSSNYLYKEFYGVAKGTGTVTTTFNGSVTDTATIEVLNVQVTSITLSPSTLTLTANGETSQLTATILPTTATDQSLTWSSSDTSMVTVDENGLVTVVDDTCNDTVTITATNEESGVTGTCIITVAIAVTGISVSPSTLTLTANEETSQLTATVSPSNAYNPNVTWTSSDTSIVTVSSNGLVTVVDGCESGDVTITATTEDGGYTDTCTVTVDIAVLTVSLLTSATSMYIGDTATVEATYTPTNANITATEWTCTPTSIITMSSGTDIYEKIITGVKAGTGTVTFTANNEVSDSLTLTVSNISVTSVTVSPSTLTLTSNSDTSQLTATVYPTTATDQSVTWTSSNTNRVTVDSTGLVSVVSGCTNGTATITCTTTDGGYTATCTVTVAIAVTSVTLTPSSLSIENGDSGTLTASYTPTNALASNWNWVNSDGSVISTSSSSSSVTVTGLSVGSATVYLIIDDVQSNSVPVTVTAKSVTGVSVSPTTFSIELGSTQQLTENVTPSDAGDTSVTWTSSDTSIATVDSDGLVTGVSAGSVTITCTTTDGGYTASSTGTISEIEATSITLYPDSIVSSDKYTNTSYIIADVEPSGVTGSLDTEISSSGNYIDLDKTGISNQIIWVGASTSGTYTVSKDSASATIEIDKSITSRFIYATTTASTKVVGDSNSKMSVPLNAYKEMKLKNSSDDSTATWESFDSSIASVYSVSSGVATIKGVSEGRTVLKVEGSDGVIIGAMITVYKPPTGISLSATSATVSYSSAQTYTFTISATNSGGRACYAYVSTTSSGDSLCSMYSIGTADNGYDSEITFTLKGETGTMYVTFVYLLASGSTVSKKFTLTVTS